MINIFIYFWLMFYMFMVFFILGSWLFFMELSFMLEWMMISINSLNFEFYMLMDWISLLFISIIFLISSMIMLYSYSYMSGEIYIFRFFYLMILFVMSMILMIISPNIISIMFGWDGLGVVSYCLVIFYQNYMSYNSGMVTVLCNRVGDIGLLMAITLMMVLGSWNIWSMESSKVIMLMLFIAAITKSAQLPFSTWLPMAMAAPTPVSALVHSSTLVTAGIYLMIRFNKFLLMSKLNFFLFFLSSLTMFMSGLMALVENDLKKIIALSTLSQLGLMMMILSVGYCNLAYYHLLTHAIFKSMLFMCAGIIIHHMMNNQDIRLLGNLNESLPFTMMSFYISSMALSGFPFMAGFYSKDLIMEIIYSSDINIFMLFMIVISLIFTVSYSVRLYYYLFFSTMKFYSYNKGQDDKVMSIAMMILIMLSMMGGSSLNWLFFFDNYDIFLLKKIKLLTVEACLLGIIFGLMLSVKNFFIKFYFLNYFLGTMWFLNYFYLWVYKNVNIFSSEIYKYDKGWLEFLSVKMIQSFLKYMPMMFYYKIYMFSVLFLFVYSVLFILI
uniref:NADH dehydrogenase subunit 5 n=1 Tax=Stenamma expolitum TaxID=625355 RepID=UPI001FCDA390|nr:NADH dehydrogenase subunit 5 [Stenamma expolitum]UNZ99536.1 NADH dehydrogenase subunit 5 [Stenamma expolitum]